MATAAGAGNLAEAQQIWDAFALFMTAACSQNATTRAMGYAALQAVGAPAEAPEPLLLALLAQPPDQVAAHVARIAAGRAEVRQQQAEVALVPVPKPIFRPMSAMQNVLRERLRGQRMLVEGNVGVGKTTLVNALTRFGRHVLGLPMEEMPEDMRALMLDHFILDPEHRAFATQMTMLMKRKKHHLLAHTKCVYEHKTTVEDRSEVGDYAFALLHHRPFLNPTTGRMQQNISDAEWAIYEDEAAAGECYQTPLLCFLLQAPVPVQKTRIVTRNRDGEADFYLKEDPTYLDRLDAVYTELMTPERLGCPIYQMDWSADAPDVSDAALERYLVAALQQAGVLGAI